MPGEEIVYSTSIMAGADLSSKQFHCIKLNASGQMILSGAGENSLGILQDKPASGQVGAVCCLGKSMAVYGASVTANQDLTPDASGRLVPATGSDAVVAVAAESGSVGEIHSVYLVSRASAGAIQKSILSIPYKLSKIANGDLVTEIVPGFPGQDHQMVVYYHRSCYDCSQSCRSQFGDQLHQCNRRRAAAHFCQLHTQGEQG